MQRSIGLRYSSPHQSTVRTAAGLADAGTPTDMPHAAECDRHRLDTAQADSGFAADLDGVGNSASILHPRPNAQAVLDGFARPMLITTLDAEEEFDWSKPFSRDAVSVAAMAVQGRAHQVFERHAVVPTYMVDYPVVSQAAGSAPLRELLQSGLCDIGAQLHAWVSPPFHEEVSVQNSYAGNLPATLEYAKIHVLTETIEQTFGVRPRIYRAGRFGVGPRTGHILKRLGYLVDSSVQPVWDYSSTGGPDFSHLLAAPYWIDAEGSLLEIPCSSAIVGLLGSAPLPVRRMVLSRWGERTGLTAAMARSGLFERIRISPEGITIVEARRLVRHMVARGHKVFVLTYHTPSLVPGNTPYVRNAEDLARFLAWLDEFYGFFTTDIGGVLTDWRDVQRRFAGTSALRNPAPAFAATLAKLRS